MKKSKFRDVKVVEIVSESRAEDVAATLVGQVNEWARSVADDRRVHKPWHLPGWDDNRVGGN